ncbi:uncharacterized protein ACR2FA_011985 [Aphomia sociella]
MTNTEDVEEQPCNPRLAALLAVHLVSRVLDEAYIIANAARESGDAFLDEVAKLKMESNLIGQGDEEFPTHDNELTKSTSTFFNHLFDMSDVEHVTMSEDDDMLTTNSESDLHVQDISNILECYLNAALSIVSAGEVHDNESQVTKHSSSSFDCSSYSLLSDAFINDGSKETAISINEVISNINVKPEIMQQIKENDLKSDGNDEKNDTLFYENAYLSLNRDYEQCSEEDGDPVLQDVKGLSLQEVELMTAHTSEADLFPDQTPLPKPKDLNATSVVSALASGSRKSSLVHRCRTHGARLLACLRGWWRRKTPGKRKEWRGSVRGLCPLSPDARRRASSLLNQSRMRSPSPSRSVVWKFNTINEGVVNSSRWKEYAFDIRPDECGEYY